MSMKNLAPQVGFEPTTLRLTVDRLSAASRCKDKYLQARKGDFGGNWGDSGGTGYTHCCGMPIPPASDVSDRVWNWIVFIFR
jgi:hypothetical protein